MSGHYGMLGFEVQTSKTYITWEQCVCTGRV